MSETPKRQRPLWLGFVGAVTAGALGVGGFLLLSKQRPANPVPRRTTAHEDASAREQSLRSAAQAAPSDPEAQLSLVRFLLQSRRAYEALDVTRAAQRLFTESLPLRLAHADLLAATGRLPEAAAELGKVRDEPEAAVAAAGYLLRDGQREAALQRLRTLKDPRPETALLAAQTALDAAAPELALEIVEPALAVRRDDLELRTTAGLAQLALGRYPEAVNTLEPAVERAPQVPVLRYYLGSALRLSGNLKRLSEAEEHLRRAVELAPREGLFFYELALARVQLRAWREARVAMERCVELMPELPEAQRDLARIYERVSPPDTVGAGLARARHRLLLQDPRGAVAELEPHHRKSPGEAKVVLLLALASHQAGNTDRSVVLLTRFRERDPANAEVVRELLRAQRAAKSYEAALHTLEKAAPDTGDTEILKEKSELLQTVQRYPEAEAVLVRLRDNEPENATRHFELGLFLTLWSRRTDRMQAAEAAFREALRLQPDYVGPHYRLGLLCESSGRPQEAVRHLRRAHELAPELWEALRPLGRAYSRLGDTERANDCFAVFRRNQTRDEERNRLELLNTRGRATPASRRELIRFYLATGAVGPALRELEALVHFDPTGRQSRAELVRYFGRARRFQRQFEERLASRSAGERKP